MMNVKQIDQVVKICVTKNKVRSVGVAVITLFCADGKWIS